LNKEIHLGFAFAVIVKLTKMITNSRLIDFFMIYNALVKNYLMKSNK